MKTARITCMIVDDEPMALSLIESYVLKTPFLELRQKCDSAIEALTLIEQEPLDLLFLDIQMPDLNGLEFSKLVPKTSRIIFTTAFSEYAIEGFKIEALDYLLKPFDYAEFLAAAMKAKKWFRLVHSQYKEKSDESTQNFLFVKSGYKQLKINLDEVLYFEGLKDYIKIWLKGNSKAILTLMSLKNLEKQLPSNKFMRVHRSFIVSLDVINEIERSQIIINNKRITVSEHYKPHFLEYLKKNSLD